MDFSVGFLVTPLSILQLRPDLLRIPKLVVPGRSAKVEVRSLRQDTGARSGISIVSILGIEIEVSLRRELQHLLTPNIRCCLQHVVELWSHLQNCRGDDLNACTEWQMSPFSLFSDESDLLLNLSLSVRQDCDPPIGNSLLNLNVLPLDQWYELSVGRGKQLLAATAS